MTYNLFIDDERYPPHDGREWIIARSMLEVEMLVEDIGMPAYVSFDHDLGHDQPSGMDIAKYMVDKDLNEERVFPDDFGFTVHSANPVGARNIELYLKQYMEFKNGSK